MRNGILFYAQSSLLALLVAGLIGAQTAFSAESDLQQWTTFDISVPIEKSPWSFGVWNQVRFNDDISHFNQFLFNPQVHYSLASGWKVGLGYQYIYKSESADEHEPWQQASLSHKFRNQFKLNNRLRLEQRFIDDISGVVFRLRYRLHGSYPLNNPKYYATGSGALWLNLNEQDTGPTSGFDQSRFFAGIGMHVDNFGRMEFGYQWRYQDNGGGPAKSDHILMLQFFWSVKDAHGQR